MTCVHTFIFPFSFGWRVSWDELVEGYEDGQVSDSARSLTDDWGGLLKKGKRNKNNKNVSERRDDDI